jgi:hypothetical protein
MLKWMQAKLATLYSGVKVKEFDDDHPVDYAKGEYIC